MDHRRPSQPPRRKYHAWRDYSPSEGPNRSSAAMIIVSECSTRVTNQSGWLVRHSARSDIERSRAHRHLPDSDLAGVDSCEGDISRVMRRSQSGRQVSDLGVTRQSALFSRARQRLVNAGRQGRIYLPVHHVESLITGCKGCSHQRWIELDRLDQ
jgi:hypothetical protein